MCKENLYAKMEKLEAQICRCTRQGLKVMPWLDLGVIEKKYQGSMAKTVKVSCWCQSEQVCGCNCASCTRRLDRVCGVSTSSSSGGAKQLPRSQHISTENALFYWHFEAHSSKSSIEKIVVILGESSASTSAVFTSKITQKGVKNHSTRYITTR